VKITTVDTHTEGQPTRIVVSGLGDIPGDSMEDRRREFRCRYDHLRTGLLSEPRGHRGMSGCVLTDPCDPKADFGALFMHNSGYMDVCGHATVGVATALVEAGIIEPEEPVTMVTLDTPAGVVVVEVAVQGERAERVRFRNVPAWMGMLGASLQVPGYGEIIVDAGYGGAYYVWAWAEHLGVELSRKNMAAVIDAAVAVLRAANESLVVRHPETGDRCEINVATILDAPRHELPAIRNVHVHGPGQFDRSPGGSGTSARLAVMHARGEIRVNEEIIVESAITEGTFRARIVAETEVGARRAVITEIAGTAHVTGIHDFLFDPEDPLNDGFLV